MNFLLYFTLFLFFPSHAFAYLDGGFITMVIQVAVASFAMLLIYFRAALYKIKDFFNKIFKKKPTNEK